MKKLLCFAALAFALPAAAQRFPVQNVNDGYVITSLKGSEKFRNNIKEVLRDENGLYWFQNLADISSYDGVNWKSYKFTNAKGRNVPVRINEIEVTDDSTIWLATAEGMYAFDRRAGSFIPVKQMFPQLKGMPSITNCIYKGLHDFLFVSFVKEGFYVFTWKTGTLKYVPIDTLHHLFVPTDRSELDVTADREGNYWGLTSGNKGIWMYNTSTGKIRCSWKGEIFPALSARLVGRKITGIAYSEKDHSLWLSYGPDGILEKLYLSTGKSLFYAFYGDLFVSADTTGLKRLAVNSVKTDGEGNEWLIVGGKYLVKLSGDPSRFEYLSHDQDLLPLGKMDWLLPELRMKRAHQDNDENLLWMVGDKGLSVLKKRNQWVRQVPMQETAFRGITPEDYMAGDAARGLPFRNVRLANGPGGDYLILQPNPGRPKLLRMDQNFKLTHSLDQWREYPAYFGPLEDQDNLYIAILRKETEPVDFRRVVIRDLEVNLATMRAEEIELSFTDRIRRYGAADKNDIYWLYSNGFLFSYNPRSRQLDSIFINDPYTKMPYPSSRIKGYDFPTVLHKNSATFWISFISNKELYRIDLVKRKVTKIIKSCLDKEDCLQSAVYQLHGFDSSRIYLKLNLSAALLNAFNDSVTLYSDLFTRPLSYEDHVGAFTYGPWLCSVTFSGINMQHTITGKQKNLSLNRDFKWMLSPLSAPPPVNARGELILLSSARRGFVVVDLDSVDAPVVPGIVRFASIRKDDKDVPLDSVLRSGSLQLNYNAYGSIHFRFSEYSLIDQEKIGYEYTLFSGGDTLWNRIEGDPELTFTKLSPGNYQLLLRATNGFGDVSPGVTSLRISVLPPFTQTVWFIVLLVVGVAGILYALYAYRLRQVRKLQVVRNNIASDLHDDIGSTLNSISIYSEVARQQAGRDIPALDLIGANSRKIIENMSDIVWTINPENDSFEKILVRMRSFAHQLLRAKKIDYTFETDERLNALALPMQVRKNLYLVFKEAVTNLVKYSGATRVAISVAWDQKRIVLKIRDNGSGIPDQPESQGNGLMNMRRRAEEIGALLKITSANGEGTGVELVLKPRIMLADK